MNNLTANLPKLICQSTIFKARQPHAILRVKFIRNSSFEKLSGTPLSHLILRRTGGTSSKEARLSLVGQSRIPWETPWIRSSLRDRCLIFYPVFCEIEKIRPLVEGFFSKKKARELNARDIAVWRISRSTYKRSYVNTQSYQTFTENFSNAVFRPDELKARIFFTNPHCGPPAP